MRVGIAVFAVVVSLTGPLITFHSLHSVAWTCTELSLLVLALTCLGLTCLTDPGFIEKGVARDPLIDKLHELELQQLEQAVTITIKVQHEGVQYKRVLNGGWTRIEPGGCFLQHPALHTLLVLLLADGTLLPR